MTGVFLSYSRLDHGLAERVIHGLRSLGCDCWWDQQMPGVNWQRELEHQINSMAALVVLWTPHSLGSEYVCDEARLALGQGKLVNILAGVSKPPFPFDRVNGLVLDGWTGREPHNAWRLLVETIDAHLAEAGSRSGELIAALERRDREIRDKRSALARAERAFTDAKLADAEAAAAARDAAASRKSAEAQLERVGEMRGSTNLLRAAQTDFDDARATDLASETARNAAAARLAAASRTLNRAQLALEALFETAPVESAPTGTLVPSTAERSTAGVGALTPLRLTALVVAAAALIAVLVGAMVWVRQPSAPAQAARAKTVVVEAPSSLAARPASAAQRIDPATAIAKAVVGDWAGNGATCQANPFRIAVDGSTVLETLSGSPSVGRIQGLASAGALNVVFPDGVETYAVSGDTLKLTVSGSDMTYTRCPA